MKNFTQKLQMECSLDFYNQNLKEHLLQMGYLEGYMTNDLSVVRYLVNNYNDKSGKVGLVSNLKTNRKTITKNHAVLFLALAAMNDSAEPTYGEVINIIDSGGFYSTHPVLKKFKHINYGKTFTGYGICMGYTIVNDEKAMYVFSGKHLYLIAYYGSSKKHIKKVINPDIVEAVISNVSSYNGVFDKANTESVSDRFPFKLNEPEAKRIINAACLDWQSRLSKKWGPDLVLIGYVSIDEAFYKEMRKACTTRQNKLFDEIFGKDETVCPYKDGELIFVRDYPNATWSLRYATGSMYNDKVLAYCNQERSGDGNVWNYHAPAPGVKLPE